MIALVLAICLIGLGGCSLFRRSTIPARMTDEQFWKLVVDLSEPPGTFTHSDNLVSNEIQFADVMRSEGERWAKVIRFANIKPE